MLPKRRLVSMGSSYHYVRERSVSVQKLSFCVFALSKFDVNRPIESNLQNTNSVHEKIQF